MTGEREERREGREARREGGEIEVQCEKSSRGPVPCPLLILGQSMGLIPEVHSGVEGLMWREGGVNGPSGLAEHPLGRLATLRPLSAHISSFGSLFFLSTGPGEKPTRLACLKPPSATAVSEASSTLSQLQSVGPRPSCHTLPSPKQTTVHFLYKRFTTGKQIRGNKNKQRGNYRDKGNRLQPPSKRLIIFFSKLD